MYFDIRSIGVVALAATLAISFHAVSESGDFGGATPDTWLQPASPSAPETVPADYDEMLDRAADLYKLGGPADVWVETTRLAPVNPLSASRFGAAMAIDADTLVVGDPDGGTISLYTSALGAWVPLGHLNGPTSFGHSVALEGDTLVVGAPWVSTVHVYERDTSGWALDTVLQGNDLFGWSVAVLGDELFVGDPRGRVVQVFEHRGSTWSPSVLLEGEGLFGESLAVDEDTLVVGAIYGRAYVFERNGTGTWTLAASLQGPRGFGMSVAVQGDTIAVGAPFDRSVHVFERHGASWSESAVLHPTDWFEGHASDLFGWSVAVRDDVIAIGAPSDHIAPAGALTLPIERPCESHLGIDVCLPPSHGAVHTFILDAGAWTITAKLSAPDAGEIDRFGESVLLDTNRPSLLVGAPGDRASLYGVRADENDVVHVYASIPALPGSAGVKGP